MSMPLRLDQLGQSFAGVGVIFNDEYGAHGMDVGWRPRLAPSMVRLTDATDDKRQPIHEESGIGRKFDPSPRDGAMR
jgi:hypothetical protein